MRDRLIELLEKEQQASIEYSQKKIKEIQEGAKGECIKTAFEFSADYLLENGVIVPPCKVGDRIYFVDEICDENADEYLDVSVGEVVSFSMQKEGLWMYCRYEDGLTYWHLVTDEFGKTVFLTKEEAEQALSKLQASYKQAKEGVQE